MEKSIKFRLGIEPTINTISKMVSLFDKLDSVIYIQKDYFRRRVNAKSILGLLSLSMHLMDVLIITFYGEYAENDEKYIEKEIRLL